MFKPVLVVLALGGCSGKGGTTDPPPADCESEVPPPTTTPATTAPEVFPSSCRPPDFAGPGAADWLFTLPEGELNRVDLELTFEAQATLVAAGHFLECEHANKMLDEADQADCGEERGFVPATVTVVRDGEDYVTLREVGVMLKGQPGSSFQPITSKPYLKLQFDAFVPGQTLDGLHAVRLYNQWEDTSQVGRYFGYKIWRGDHDEGTSLREGSYPAARAGFATVRSKVGDGPAEELGLYGTTEQLDTDFLAQWPTLRNVTQLYEGEYGVDLVAGQTEDLELICGPVDLTAVNAFATRIEEGTLSPEEEDRFLQYWALEVAVGAREGYSSAINNYFVAIDDEGSATILPTGFDQVLYDEVPVREADTTILTEKLKLGFRAELRAQLGDIDWLLLQDELDEVLEELRPYELGAAVPNAYEQTEVDFAKKNVQWYAERARAHLEDDLDYLDLQP